MKVSKLSGVQHFQVITIFRGLRPLCSQNQFSKCHEKFEIMILFPELQWIVKPRQALTAPRRSLKGRALHKRVLTCLIKFLSEVLNKTLESSLQYFTIFLEDWTWLAQRIMLHNLLYNFSGIGLQGRNKTKIKSARGCFFKNIIYNLLQNICRLKFCLQHLSCPKNSFFSFIFKFVWKNWLWFLCHTFLCTLHYTLYNV